MFFRLPGKDRSWAIVDRLYHRQMYIDLVSAYLRDYGSQVKLARALGVTEAAISQLLTPAYLPEPGRRRSGRARRMYWADLILDPPSGDLAATLSLLKTPNRERAEQIAAELGTDGERRDCLLHHMAMARRTPPTVGDELAYADPDDVTDRLRRLGRQHEHAMYTGDPVQARIGYARVWDASSQFLEHIDPVRQPIERVQLLLFLQDAASVLNRADLALAYARSAILLLATDAARRHPMWARFLTNAMLAEVVSLNNLCLVREAKDIAERALTRPVYQEEPQAWRRALLEQRLRSLGWLPGDHLYDAEATADQALALASATHGTAAGINAYLVQLYVRRGSREPRLRLRKAGRLVDALWAAAMSVSTSTVRRVRLLRAIAAYAHAGRDEQLRDEALRQALGLSESAGLRHHADALLRLEIARRHDLPPRG